jgi:phosphoglycolate phosphatase
VQTVLSGNIRPNAVTKLSVFGLDKFMDFEAGGYGSDDEVRANLVAIAQRRAGRKHGIAFGKANTVLVGDTPRDVQAGLMGGAQVVAVATGSDSADVLQAVGADIVLPDLRDTRAVLMAVTSLVALSRVQGGEDLPGELRAGGGNEFLARCHGLGDVGQSAQAVVEGQGLAVEG